MLRRPLVFFLPFLFRFAFIFASANAFLAELGLFQLHAQESISSISCGSGATSGNPAPPMAVSVCAGADGCVAF